MKSIKIKQISEAEIDSVVCKAGGKRLIAEGSADYELNESFIELKLVEEEGLDKETRQAKIAALSTKHQPDSPVVLIDPAALDEQGRREYYNTVIGPIQTHVKKAAKQLEVTANRERPTSTRVLLIANVGYTALCPDEFRAMCLKCVRNDTSRIDWLICAGVYYHSDGFNSWVNSRFEDIPINLDRPFPSRNRLAEEWNAFLTRAMSEHIRNGPLKVGRLPVIDLVFDYDGTRFVKPTPAMPTSDFWPGGIRPRVNSRENDPPLPVALSFPRIASDDWIHFRTVFPHEEALGQSYAEWLKIQSKAEVEVTKNRKTFVAVDVQYADFAGSMTKPVSDWRFSEVLKFANDLFNTKILALLEDARDDGDLSIMPLEYLHVCLNEIGSDRGNDLCTIRHICELPGFERNEIIHKNIRAFWEEGACLAACEAFKRKVDMILFRKIKAFA